jgi:hypothetical protein
MSENTTVIRLVPNNGERALNRTELIERAQRLTNGYGSRLEAYALIDAAIEQCALSRSRWETRQVSHAIAMTGLGLWRAVGAAIVEAFGPEAGSREPTGDEVSIAMLQQMRAQLDGPVDQRFS